jgi:hypothetical protein
MPKEEHVHKYKRTKLGKFKVYRCMLSGCPHYVRAELVTNRMTVCWRCGNSVTMTPQMAMQAKPHCRDCNKSYIGAAGREALANKSELKEKTNADHA